MVVYVFGHDDGPQIARIFIDFADFSLVVVGCPKLGTNKILSSLRATKLSRRIMPILVDYHMCFQSNYHPGPSGIPSPEFGAGPFPSSGQ